MPVVDVIERDLDGDDMVILACDGIWDVTSNEEAVAMVRKLLKDGEGDAVMVMQPTPPAPVSACTLTRRNHAVWCHSLLRSWWITA